MDISNIIIEAGAEPHSPTHTSFQLRHSSLSNPSAALPKSQLILQPFRCFTYVIGTSPSSQLIINPSSASPTSQLIVQTFHCFTYVIGTSPTLQLILQPFRYFTNVKAHSSSQYFFNIGHSVTQHCQYHEITNISPVYNN